MNIVKRITRHRALRAQVQAWCAEVHERLNIRLEDPRTIPGPPDGYRRFHEAVELEDKRTRAICKLKDDERRLINDANEKLRCARIAEPSHQQYLALKAILPEEVEQLSNMDQQWYRARMHDLMIEHSQNLIEQARLGDTAS